MTRARGLVVCVALALGACDGDDGVILPDGSVTLPPPPDGATVTDASPSMDAPRPMSSSDGGALPACGAQARTDDPSGDYVLLGNAPGGRFTFVVDVRLRAVGVLARGPVDVTFTGPFADALQRVFVVGGSAGTAVVRGVAGSVVQRVTSPMALTTPPGASMAMTCVTTCMTDAGVTDPACNTLGQFFDWFTSRLQKGLRWWHVQPASFDGLRFEASRGGCCLP